MEAVNVFLLGQTGLYCHRMSQKASRELLLGGRRKTQADRAHIKHHPRDEFRASMFIDEERHPDAVVFMPAVAFKRAMRTVAAEIAGVKGTQVDRLIFVEDEMVPIYGTPRLRMDITRSSDINRTPDVRTRAYFPQWGTELRIRFAKPQLNKATVGALLGNAGILIGVGDNRQEKGKGNFGTFEVVAPDAIDHLRGKVAQAKAVADALPDQEHGDTVTLLAEYDAEVQRRA